MRQLAFAIALGLLAPLQCQAQQYPIPAGDVADPASVSQRDIVAMMVIVPDCQDWEDPSSIQVCGSRKHPPSVCIFMKPAWRIFEILDAALDSTHGEAGAPSDYFQATVLMALRDGRTLRAEIPLFPTLEQDGDKAPWADYGARRIKLDRDAWGEISALARSPWCVKQPRQWGWPNGWPAK